MSMSKFRGSLCYWYSLSALCPIVFWGSYFLGKAVGK